MALNARDQLKKLMMEFEFRCHRAALMDYELASDLDDKVWWAEALASVMGGVAFITLIGSVLKKFKGTIIWAAFLILAVVLEFIGRGSVNFLPSLSQRARNHNEAAARWQKLAHQAKFYTNQLDSGELDISKYKELYTELITERKDVCTIAIVPHNMYLKYNDPEKIINALKKRQEVFKQYQKLLEEYEPSGEKEVFKKTKE